MSRHDALGDLATYLKEEGVRVKSTSWIGRPRQVWQVILEVVHHKGWQDGGILSLVGESKTSLEEALDNALDRLEEHFAKRS